MGCDIHLHTEVKIEGRWHHYGHPHIERNYTLFAKMANVRNENGREPCPLVPHKGIPFDATDLTKISRRIEEGDRDGWLDIEQICELVKWYERTHPDDAWGLEGLFDFVFCNGWAGIPNDDVQDARFIFWFDN